MSYQRILQCVYGEPWAVLPATHETIRQVLAEHIAGRSGQLAPARNHFSAQTLQLDPPRIRASRVYRRGQLAYIPVNGIIGKNLSMMEEMCGGYSIDQLARDIDEAESDPSCRNVLFDFNSPGGRIQGVPETARMIAKMAKETYAFSSDMAASAAYWLYSQAKHRYLTETAVLGSVGVIVVMFDRTKQFEMQGVTPVIVKAGAHKDAGLPGRPFTAEELDMVQTQVTMIYDMMTADIKRAHSGISMDALQGQIFLGKQSLDAKLADGISSLGQLVLRLS